MTAPRYYGTQAWKRLRLRVLERDRFRCVICGGPAKGLTRNNRFNEVSCFGLIV